MKRNAPLKKINPSEAIITVACMLLEQESDSITCHTEACEQVDAAISRAAEAIGADIDRPLDDVIGELYFQVHERMGYDFPSDDGSGDCFIVRGTHGNLFCDKVTGEVINCEGNEYKQIICVDLVEFRKWNSDDHEHTETDILLIGYWHGSDKNDPCAGTYEPAVEEVRNERAC